MPQPRRTARKRTARPPDGAVKFPAAERRQVAEFLGLDKDDPVILGLIAVSRQSGLSVFTGELFAIDTLEPSRNAEGVIEERWTKRPAAGRDGLRSSTSLTCASTAAATRPSTGRRGPGRGSTRRR
jgi:hypothetical protein